jgi:hypothetical protein
MWNKNIGTMEQKHHYKATVKEQSQYKCGSKLQYMWNKKYRDMERNMSTKGNVTSVKEQIVSKHRTKL